MWSQRVSVWLMLTFVLLNTRHVVVVLVVDVVVVGVLIVGRHDDKRGRTSVRVEQRGRWKGLGSKGAEARGRNVYTHGACELGGNRPLRLNGDRESQPVTAQRQPTQIFAKSSASHAQTLHAHNPCPLTTPCIYSPTVAPAQALSLIDTQNGDRTTASPQGSSDRRDGFQVVRTLVMVFWKATNSCHMHL